MSWVTTDENLHYYLDWKQGFKLQNPPKVQTLLRYFRRSRASSTKPGPDYRLLCPSISAFTVRDVESSLPSLSSEDTFPEAFQYPPSCDWLGWGPHYHLKPITGQDGRSIRSAWSVQRQVKGGRSLNNIRLLSAKKKKLEWMNECWVGHGVLLVQFCVIWKFS